jgi:hypothetical protein
MKVRMRYVLTTLIVVVALGAVTIVVSITGGGAQDTGTPHPRASACEPAPARCGSEDNDLVIAAATEAARRELELATTGTTTVTYSVRSAPQSPVQSHGTDAGPNPWLANDCALLLDALGEQAEAVC